MDVLGGRLCPCTQPRARGSRQSNRPGRGRPLAVISCRCRTPRRVTMASTRGSWGTSSSRTGGHAGQASPPPCLLPPSPARAPHCSWTRCGAQWSDCSLPLRWCWRHSPAPPGFAAAWQGRHPPGPPAMAAWPAEVGALATGSASESRRAASRSSGRGCSGTSRRPFCWRASALRAPSGRSPPGASALRVACSCPSRCIFLPFALLFLALRVAFSCPSRCVFLPFALHFLALGVAFSCPSRCFFLPFALHFLALGVAFSCPWRCIFLPFALHFAVLCDRKLPC